jgi:hypothetical protein
MLGPSAKITRKMLICARGVAKVFVGQLIETGFHFISNDYILSFIIHFNHIFG